MLIGMSAFTMTSKFHCTMTSVEIIQDSVKNKFLDMILLITRMADASCIISTDAMMVMNSSVGVTPDR